MYHISRGQCSSFYTSIETHLAVGMIMLAKVSARSNRSEALQAKKLTIYCICEIFAGQKFGQPQLPLYCRNFLWKSFHDCGEGRHVLFAIINTGQKNLHDNIFDNKSRWRNWQKFLQRVLTAFCNEFRLRTIRMQITTWNSARVSTGQFKTHCTDT